MYDQELINEALKIKYEQSKKRIAALEAENARLREALDTIADYDASEAEGYLDEWAEAASFTACQKLAREALADTHDR